MFVLITTFENMVIKFVGGCSVATYRYVIIYCKSKIYSFARVSKLMLLWQSIMKMNYYVMNLAYIKWDLVQWTANCFTAITAAVYIKMICIIEALHYWRNLETRLV